ncbi:MAG: hypothetical protein RIQ56_75 [Candidatus Parcubacteria bacterium]|jgi:large subunit ribosomal protein L23
MALFSRKTKDKKEAASGEVVAPVVSSGANLAAVLKHARITEKATMHAEMGSYVFDIADVATKSDVAKAVKKLFNVTPRMVRIVRTPSKVKRNMRTGKSGVRGGGKKAYVYLKKGETITLA